MAIARELAGCLRASLSLHPTPFARNDVPSHAEQPGDRFSPARAVAVGRLDGGDEHVGGEVGRKLGVGYAARDEALDVLDMSEIEDAERLGVVADAPRVVARGGHLPGS
jgi:hypothetical protein